MAIFSPIIFKQPCYRMIYNCAPATPLHTYSVIYLLQSPKVLAIWKSPSVLSRQVYKQVSSLSWQQQKELCGLPLSDLVPHLKSLNTLEVNFTTSVMVKWVPRWMALTILVHHGFLQHPCCISLDPVNSAAPHWMVLTLPASDHFWLLSLHGLQCHQLHGCLNTDSITSA